MRVRAHKLLGVVVLLGACAKSEASTPVVEFGVLFGGDVQDRTAIPLDPDPSRRELALRVSFPEPLTRETRVSWELERPTKARTPDGDVAYAAEIGERRVQPGERRVDAKLRLRAGDPLGTWRIRVHVEERLALERAFQVVRPEDD